MSPKGHECGGYRDPSSLESSRRDEGASSRHDINSEDSNNSGSGGHNNSNEDLHNDQRMSSNEVTSQNNNHVARPFSLLPDMTGLNFCLGHYVVRQSGPSTGFLDYNFAILAQEDSNEMLEGGILALGFTGLARTTQQQDLMLRPR